MTTARHDRHHESTEARAGVRIATLEAVSRRRRELLVATAVVLVGGFLALILVSYAPRAEALWMHPEVVRFSVLGLGLGFLAYVGEKERYLRRLTDELVTERLARQALGAEMEIALRDAEHIRKITELHRELARISTRD